MNDWITEKVDFYRGHRYAIMLNTRYGYRCGYVEIPEEHPEFQQPFVDIPIESIQLTFGGRLNGFNGWWIGFDHFHFYDGVDEEVIKQYNPTNYEELIESAQSMKESPYLSFATTDKVERECQTLIDEIVDEL